MCRLRRARYGYLLAFHILLLCAAGRNPTEIAAFLFCSRSSVYHIVRAYRTGSLGIHVDREERLSIAVQTSVLTPWLTRSLGAILKGVPRAYGWCRTRWSCATLAATLQANPAPWVTQRIYVVVDNYCIDKAKAVEQWVATHPRFTLLWLPTYCPRANPIERVFGDVHDKCTRNHKRKRLRDVGQDVEGPV